MARQGDWNKSFWRNLDKFEKNKIDQIRQVMLEEVGITEAVLQENTPIKYGGLKTSVYGVVADTPDGVSARVGYTQTPHWNLDPTNPHQDEFTNPTLMGYLENKPGKSAANIRTISTELDRFQDRIRTRVYDVLKF